MKHVRVHRYLAGFIVAAILVSVYVHLFPWRDSGDQVEDEQKAFQQIRLLGGFIDETSVTVPSAYFLKESGNGVVPESIKKIWITGILTNSHNLSRLPTSVESLDMTISTDATEAIATLPKFSDVRNLTVKLVSISNRDRVRPGDAVALRSRFSKSIFTLDLSGDALSDSLISEFQDCVCLQELRLSGGIFTGSGLAGWPTQHAMERVFIRGNIANSEMANFPALPNAVDLSINSTGALSSGLLWLGECPKIRFLELSGLEVNNSGILAISSLNEIDTLRFYKSGIKDFSALDGLRQLRKLEIFNCNLLDGAFASWPASVPLLQLILKETPIEINNFYGICRIATLELLDADEELDVEPLAEIALPSSLQKFVGRNIDLSNELLVRLKIRHPGVDFRILDESTLRNSEASLRLMEVMRQWRK